MNMNKNICVLTNDHSLKSSLEDAFHDRYLINFVYSGEDLAKVRDQAKLFIFDEQAAYWFFYQKRELSIDPKRVIVIGEDNQDKLRLFYSIGLTNFLLRHAFQNHLMVKVEFMMGELLSHQADLLALTDEDKWGELTYKEKLILKILCHRPDQVIDRSEIIRYVWQNKKVHSRTFDVHLHNLRKKIEKRGHKIITQGAGRYQIYIQAASSAA